MKIILVIKNSLGKNIAFVTNNLKVFLLAQILELTKRDQIEGVYLVKKNTGLYLRSKKSIPKKLQLDKIAISSDDISSFINLKISGSTPLLSAYTILYNKSLADGDQPILKPIGNNLYSSTATVKEKILSVKQIIYEAAEHFDIDPFQLGAILIDESARMFPFEEITDCVGAKNIGANTSIGLAQVKIDTANNIIKKKLYNPNPSDPKLPLKRVNRDTRAYFYDYLIQPKHNIFFGAAVLADLIDIWKKFINLKNHFNILATLYSLSRVPHANPQPSDRGNQIAGEFYDLAKEWL